MGEARNERMDSLMWPKWLRTPLTLNRTSSCLFANPAHLNISNEVGCACVWLGILLFRVGNTFVPQGKLGLVGWTYSAAGQGYAHASLPSASHPCRPYWTRI